MNHTALKFGRFILAAASSATIPSFPHTSLVLMWSLERQLFTLPFYKKRIFRVIPLATTAAVASSPSKLDTAHVPRRRPRPRIASS